MFVWEKKIPEVSLCAFDIETSGFSKEDSEIIEIAVWRKDPKKPWECILDTLIRPEFPITNSEIHGIRDRDVVTAPRFPELAPYLLAVLSDSMLVAHNVYFDVPFLLVSLERCGYSLAPPPHLCSIYLRKMAGFPVPAGTRHSLEWAAKQHQIQLIDAHQARNDAYVVTQLLNVYIRNLLKQSYPQTWGELAQGHSYQFLESWQLPFWSAQQFPIPAPIPSLCKRS